VASLPGVKGPLVSKTYTGFLDAGAAPAGPSAGALCFHYWMVESEGDPSKDPVLIWYNGGPGASSLFGMLQEFGPYMLNEESFDAAFDASGIPSPKLNPWRWSMNHTLVAIDSPPPMGLSFCAGAGPSGNATSCGPWRDSTVFAANHQAHKAFFTTAFPELKSNPVYFVGESYAGIYVPGFVEAMIDDPVPGLNLQGMMVGDGWTGCKMSKHQKHENAPANWCIDLDNVGIFKYPNANAGPWYDVQFFHGHSQFSEELYGAIMEGCPYPMLKGDVPLNGECSVLMSEMASEVGDFFAYNLFNQCPEDEMRRRLSGIGAVSDGHFAQHGGAPAHFDGHGIWKSSRARKLAARQISSHAYGAAAHGEHSHSGLSSPCLGDALPQWLLLDATLAAIGAPAGSSFINLDNGHGFNYTSDQPFVGGIYTKALAKGLRTLIYEGDNDACGLSTVPVEDVFVSHFNSIGLNKTQRWRPWTIDGKRTLGGCASTTLFSKRSDAAAHSLRTSASACSAIGAAPR
jgi:cathepsin A (carboxypeptidase C)